MNNDDITIELTMPLEAHKVFLDFLGRQGVQLLSTEFEARVVHKAYGDIRKALIEKGVSVDEI